MCVASMVSDYGQQQFPDWRHWQSLPGNPVTPSHPYPRDTFTPAEAERIRELMRLFQAAQEIDRVTGQPACQDPAKAQFERAVMDRLDAIETNLGMR